MALTGAVRKGGLLRGKVPQGETSPLKPCVKGLRSGPELKKTLAMTLGIALFFDHGVRHGLARRWRQGYGSAAAHCAELRSFRRGRKGRATC